MNSDWARTGPRQWGLNLAQRPNWTKVPTRPCGQTMVTARVSTQGDTLAAGAMVTR
jgi:hypothetical protein